MPGAVNDATELHPRPPMDSSTIMSSQMKNVYLRWVSRNPRSPQSVGGGGGTNKRHADDGQLGSSRAANSACVVHTNDCWILVCTGFHIFRA